MSRITSACLLSFALLLSACGGGSSSGGGGTAADGGMSTGGGAPAGGGSSVAGTYVGPGTIAGSAGGETQTISGAIQVVISQDNSVAFGAAGEAPVGTTTLNASGDGFTVNVPGSFLNDDEIACSGTLVIAATISGNTITGTVTNSDLVCNGLPVTGVTGNFTANRT